MYGEFLLLAGDGKPERAERVFIRADKAWDEARLRDELFTHPEIIPVKDIDRTFGPLLPLCTELRTDAGPIDAVFINPDGRLTVLECKLWKNPEARREVIAQTLDYVSAMSQWTYADLQRQVSAALGQQGNVPFEVARRHAPHKLHEHEFVDAVSRSLREVRILALIMGDGIREGLKSLTELVNRSGTKAFSLGLIEVALYKMKNGSLLMQPALHRLKY